MEISLEREVYGKTTPIIKQNHQSNHQIPEPLMQENEQRFVVYDFRVELGPVSR